MPVWLTIVTAGLKLIGLVGAAENLINNWQQRQQGKAELRDEIDRSTAEAKAREAADFSAPRPPDWEHSVDSLP